MTATLVIGARSWLVVAGLVLAIALIAVAVCYRQAGSPRSRMYAAAGLKLLAFALLAVLLVEPLWSGIRPRPGANLFLVLADDSRSLEVRDAERRESRGEAMKRVLVHPASGWQARLTRDFDVRRYVAGARLQTAENFSGLAFHDHSSRMGAALEQLGRRFDGRPVAGLLLLTDGCAADFGRAVASAAELPPVYPVLVSGASPRPDLRVEEATATQAAFEDAPVSVRVDVGATEFEGRDVTVELRNEQGEVVGELTQPIRGERSSFVFKLRPVERGTFFYRVRVFAAGESEQFEHSEASDEATLANNVRLVRIDGGAEKRRVLYVGGRPNWEFKFLNRALSEDDRVDLAALIRVGRREAKFDFRGRAGESSNPLYRGFKGAADEETESYDEAVLVRLNMRDADELRSGFPKTEKELFAFNAVILDDVEAAFFTSDQLALLERFVSRRGGGLLMLGGSETFEHGGYERTPVSRMLPVFLEARRERRERSDASGHRLELTREGWLVPWVRLRPNEAEERQRLDQMPEFRVLSRTGHVKPGAAVLATAGGAGAQVPALAVQRFGRGRTAAMMVGDFWKWQMGNPKSEIRNPKQIRNPKEEQQGESEDLARAWRQMVRWLVADVPGRLAVEFEPVEGEDAVRMLVRARTAEYEPLENSGVVLSVSDPQGRPVSMTAEASLGEPGLYEATFVPRQPGVHRVLATVTDEEGQAIGVAENAWAWEPEAEEFGDLTPRRELLEELAAKTRGKVLGVEELDDLVAELPSRQVPIVEARTWPLWHQGWVFLVAVGCLVGEWGLRRYGGLA